MPITLISPYLQLTVNIETATWSLHGVQPHAPFIEDAWMHVKYRAPLSALLRSGRRRHHSLDEWRNPKIDGPKEIRSTHGMLEQITIENGPDINGLYYIIRFALAQEHPILLWQLTIDNQGKHALEIEQLKMMQAGFFPRRKLLPNPGPLSGKYRTNPVGYGAVRPNPDPGELAFFSNGWQSWSFTGTLGSHEKYRNTRLGFFAKPMWFNYGTPRPSSPGHFASDMFGMLGDRQHRTGILAGFLSQKEHFGSLEANTDPLYPALALWANGDQARLGPGLQMTTDWAAIQFVDIDDPDPLAPYLDAVAREHNLQSSIFERQPSIGWCSWYQFYQDISESKIRKNLQSAAQIKATLPFDLFQIDDGFQAQIGDWLSFSPNFPNGVAPLAQEIRQAGFTPGLWLAPFIVHSNSQLKRRHPNWLLRNRRGQLVNAGFVWNNFNTALDLTHPEALDYVRDVIHKATHDWCYRFLKLDFLFAAALQGRHHDRSKTRAQVLRKGLEAVREAAGADVHLLGCGVPLGPSIGIFNSMRIGADVNPSWQPSFAGLKFPFRDEYPMPSTRNAIQNALTRASLHQRWWVNDADCLIVRPDSQLSLDEVQSLATVIALTGGPMLLSDDLPGLPPERQRIAEQLVPLIGKRPRVIDWFETASPNLLRLDLENTTGKWYLLAVFNWNEDQATTSILLEKLALPAGQYIAREFWSAAVTRITEERLTIERIPAHGVRLLALRPFQAEKASYLGGNLHISQGLEVTQWSETPKNIHLRLEKSGQTRGQIALYLPRPPSRITANQIEIHWQAQEKNVYLLPLAFDGVADLEIR
jgi:alpha-galactosidase